MSFETPNSAEKQPIRMTQEEFTRISDAFGDELDSEDIQAELKRLGITLDSGPANIIVDGEPMRMVTDRRDFGTIIEDTDAPME